MPKTTMYDAVTLTEMKEFYTVKQCNLKELATQFGGSTTSVRKALADSGATIRTRGRVKGKAVGPRKPRVSVVVPQEKLSNLADTTTPPSVDRADELEKFLSVLRKD